MDDYRTPERERTRAKAKRDAIKAAGGAEYAALLAREREARQKFRAAHPESTRADRKKYEKTRPGYHKKRLVLAARRRGRERGLEATIRVSDLVWPTHCPVLGIPLDYPERGAARKTGAHNPGYPSLDRWDNAKGYVAGNVFVISHRANTLKGSATYEEILRIAEYVAHKPDLGALPQADNTLQADRHVAADELP